MVSVDGSRAPIGFSSCIRVLEQRGTPHDRAALAGAAKLQARYGSLSNESFVEFLYVNTLGRGGDTGGIACWTGTLNVGALDRGDVLLGFSESLEHQLRTLASIDKSILLA